MNLRDGFKKLAAWFGGDKSDPRNRFLNLDGSAYGSNRVMKYLTAQPVKLGLALSLAETALQLCAAPPAQRAHKLLVCIAGDGCLLLASQILFFDYYKKLRERNMVIDKLGHAGDDPNLTFAMSVVYGKFTSKLYRDPFLWMSLPFSLFTSPAIAFLYISIGVAPRLWSYYAMKKLRMGAMGTEGGWTVNASPPELKKKESVFAWRPFAPAAQGLRLAPAPGR